MMITAAVTNIILAGGFLILKYLEMAFQMVQGESWNSHEPHDCFWSSFWAMNRNIRIQLVSVLWEDIRILYLLSAPPNWLTASTNRWCNSGVHFSLGLASVERTSPESPWAFPPRKNRCCSIGKDVLVVKSSLGPWCWWYICCRKNMCWSVSCWQTQTPSGPTLSLLIPFWPSQVDKECLMRCVLYGKT